MNVEEAIKRAPSLSSEPLGMAQRLVQLVRSTPYLTSVLVGHKTFDHVSKNTELSVVSPLDNATFYALFDELGRKPVHR